MEEAARLNAGEVVTIASRWGPKNVVDGIVKDGVDQLTSSGDASMLRASTLERLCASPDGSEILIPTVVAQVDLTSQRTPPPDEPERPQSVHLIYLGF